MNRGMLGVFNSNVLFGVAEMAFREPRGKGDTLVVIVFSTATLEAIINEVRLFSSMGDTHTALASRLADENVRRMGLVEKCGEVYRVLTEKKLGTGEHPWQELHNLVALRNWIIHHKGEEIDLEGGQSLQKVVASMQQRNLIEKPLEGVVTSELELILDSPHLPRWCCETTQAVAHAIKTWLPENVTWQNAIPQDILNFKAER